MAWRTRTQQQPPAPPEGDVGVSATAGPPRADALRRGHSRRAYRHRHQIRPWQALALIPAALVVHVLPWPPMFARLLIVLASTGLLAWRLHVLHRDRWDQRLYAGACVTAGGLWLLYAARTGLWGALGRYSLLGFLLGWLPLSWLWWDRHRVRTPTTVRPAEVATETDRFILDWRAKVQPATGWDLFHDRGIDAGHSYVVQLVPGQTIEDAEQAKRKIASLLRMHRSRFTFEPMPGEGPGDSGDESVIRLIVTAARNPHLQDDQTWQGPTLDKTTGLYRHGVYPDEAAFLRLFKVDNGVPHRACNSLWTGTTGSGKSRGLALRIAEMVKSGMFIIWYADGKNGASAPELEGRVDWYCDTSDETTRMLRAAWKVMKVRGRIVKKLHQAAFRGEHVIRLGSAGFRFLQVILDEAQEFLKLPIVARLVKAILRMGNECGMGMDLATQVPLLSELGAEAGDGGAQVIRAMAKSGGVVVYRADDSFTGTVTLADDMTVNPAALPRVPGSCYVAGLTARSAECRGYYVSKEALAEWLADEPVHSLEEASARAAGEDYATRRQRAADNDIAPEEIDLEDLDTELAILLGEKLEGQQDAGEVQEKYTVKQAVLEVVRAAGGPIKRDQVTSDLAARGMTPSKSAIDQALRWWCDHGHLERAHGHYDLVTRENAERVPVDA